MKRRLPIGIQDFISIREDRYIYVDKIAIIYELLNGSGKTFFLSRPCCFGKFLLYSTLLNTTMYLYEKYGVALEGETPSARFTRLTNNLREKAGEKVAVIIDEYDKPCEAPSKVFIAC
jgi:hypothetical protein